jgi:hypothetical protein
VALLLYINGQQADLEPGQQIARTLQVNDLNSLDSRQASYTNKFKLPKTSTNLKIMEFLTVTGNNSNIPYQKNECSLYSDSGECFVYKGRAVITDGGKDFEAVLYDGIIDFYKAIENKNLSGLGLDGLTHTKSIQAVKDSWQNDYNYRYILADYNGKTGNTAEGEVNIDYLVPSVKVSYLWDRIFEKFEAGYTGSVFETEDFLNLWMTFPKGITTAQSTTNVFESDNYHFLGAATPNTDYPVNNRYFARFNTFQTSDLHQAPYNIHYTVSEAGRYKLEISGKIQAFEHIFLDNEWPFDDPDDEDAWVLFIDDSPIPSRIYLSRNAQGTNPLLAQPDEILFPSVPFNSNFENTFYLDLEALESFCLVVGPAHSLDKRTFFIRSNNSSLTVKLTKINQTAVSFDDALIDLSVRDFLTEVVQRFGLTMFKDKYSNIYNFLTLQEHLQTEDIVNWSDKFIAKTKENYIVGSYAQRNWFRYNYNDKEAAHYDSYIDIANVNLPDSKDIIKSKIYAPEKPLNRSSYLNSTSNIYKLWDKEIVENPGPGEDPFTYKALDKRFYFLRAEPKYDTIQLMSDELGDQDDPIAITYYREVYRRLNFKDIIRKYYLPQLQILDKSLMVSAELWLTETDMASFDFKKLYYIEQLSAYFIVNKISNYVPGKPVKCELVKVDYGKRQEVLPNALINNVTLQDGNKAIIEFEMNTELPATLQISPNNAFWYNMMLNPQSPHVTYPLPAGTYYFRFICGSQLSNVASITIE